MKKGSQITSNTFQRPIIYLHPINHRLYQKCTEQKFLAIFFDGRNRRRKKNTWILKATYS